MMIRSIQVLVFLLSFAAVSAQAQHKVLITPAGTGPSLVSLGAEFSHDLDFIIPLCDIWWDDSGTGDLSVCVAGSCADSRTGFFPSYTYNFTGSARGGGFTTLGIGIYVQGNLVQTLPDYWVNSPDINGDLAVNIADIGEFALDFAGNYKFRSDFNPDGQINLVDVGILGLHNGETCP